MDDKFPPLDWSLRPETWAYRMPQAFLGLAPTFWTMPTPLSPSSDVRNHRSLIAPFGAPPSRGILGQLTQLIDPPSSQTAWHSPTFLTPFLPASATTAQLNSSSYQSSVPAGSPKPLGAGFTSAPVESFDRPSTDQASNEIGGPSVQPPAPRVPLSGPDGWYYPEPAPPAPPEDFRTRLREVLSDRNLRYYAGPGFSEFLDKLAGLIPLLPGSGTVQSMQDGAQAGKDLEAGNYGNAAANLAAGVVNTGLDWLPAGKQLAILGGVTAKTFPWAKLKIAEAMEKAGKSVDEIWRATGLERGADKFWRFEISDRGYRVKPNVGV